MLYHIQIISRRNFSELNSHLGTDGYSIGNHKWGNCGSTVSRPGRQPELLT